MPHYLFIHDANSQTFPERYRVVSAEDDAEFLRTSEDLTGTVMDVEAIAFLEELTARHSANESLAVELVDAPHWQFIEQRFKAQTDEEIEQTATNHPFGGMVR